jgi:hypothetical protein
MWERDPHTCEVWSFCFLRRRLLLHPYVSKGKISLVSMYTSAPVAASVPVTILDRLFHMNPSTELQIKINAS